MPAKTPFRNRKVSLYALAYFLHFFRCFEPYLCNLVGYAIF